LKRRRCALNKEIKRSYQLSNQNKNHFHQRCAQGTGSINPIVIYPAQATGKPWDFFIVEFVNKSYLLC
jgi:hypothetical protein